MMYWLTLSEKTHSTYLLIISMYNIISATVALDKVADFEENFKQHNTGVRSKKLHDSIKAAQRIFEGTSSFEGKSKALPSC